MLGVIKQKQINQIKNYKQMKKSVIDEIVERIEGFQGKNWIPKTEVKKWKEAHNPITLF